MLVKRTYEQLII